MNIKNILPQYRTVMLDLYDNAGNSSRTTLSTKEHREFRDEKLFHRTGEVLDQHVFRRPNNQGNYRY